MGRTTRLNAPRTHSHLRDFVYGAIDGTVTTFAVVAGVAGAGLSTKIIVILGVANLVADGFSMAAGNFLGTRAERQQRDQSRERQLADIRANPEDETREIRRIFEGKGLTGDPLARVVDAITDDEVRWLDTVMAEKHGFGRATASPLRAGAATFGAFVLVGLLPLVPFLLALSPPIAVEGLFAWSAILTGTAFFIVGATKSLFVSQGWFWSGLETLGVGAGAALLAFGLGSALEILA